MPKEGESLLKKIEKIDTKYEKWSMEWHEHMDEKALDFISSHVEAAKDKSLEEEPFKLTKDLSEIKDLHERSAILHGCLVYCGRVMMELQGLEKLIAKELSEKAKKEKT